MNIINYIAEAAVKVDPGKVGLPPVKADDVIAGALNLAYFSAGAVAVVVIVLAGYTFSTAVYDQAKITQAKNAILYAVVGLIVIIIAFTITQFIMGKF